MKTKDYVLMILCLFLLSGIAFGDRQLERADIVQILQNLTSQPKKTWIPAGTIQSTHEQYKAPVTTDAGDINAQITKEIQDYQNNPDKRELTEELQKMKLDAIPFNVRYRLSNEYTMDSTVVVKYDGERFYWQINVNSRSDSVQPDASLQANYMAEYFNLDWNARRRYTWDGQKYTVYSLSANRAVVDTTDSIPHVVNGPLTAGFIPWGYDRYTYENLSETSSSAIEKDVNGQTQIHLTLSKSDGTEMSFVLDADRDYALISSSIEGLEKTISIQYDDYRLVSGSLVPMKILIEEYDAVTNRLLASDLWNITSISGNVPSLGQFSADYEHDALIEYRSDVTAKPASYRYSYTADSDRLLTERLDYAASEGMQAQNCATAAMKYAASQLGRDLDSRQLARLVRKTDGATSLKEMKDFAQRCGLYCRAVKTDIQTLKSLSGCQVILHFPGKNHFVAIDQIDNNYAWTVDLSKDRFYYRADLNFLSMDWTDGTALLISDNPIQLQGNGTEINDSRLSNIIGGSGYTCTRLLQEDYVVYCQVQFEMCFGYYQEYFERYGCEAAESGSCVHEIMDRKWEILCITGIYYCTVSGDWIIYYIPACA